MSVQSGKLLLYAKKYHGTYHFTLYQQQQQQQFGRKNFGSKSNCLYLVCKLQSAHLIKKMVEKNSIQPFQ